MPLTVGGRRLFDGLVLAATGCRVADVLEPILSSTTPLLRLEFVPCSSAATPGGLEIERLELYRLDASPYDNDLASPPIYFYFFVFVIISFSLNDSSRSTTFVLNKEASRDYCGLYVFNKWLEHRICSSSMDADSRRLLLDNEAPFKQAIPFISFFSFWSPNDLPVRLLYLTLFHGPQR